MFKLTAGKGFSVVLPNDWEVSVQWGPGNHSDNRWNNAIPYDKSEPEYGEWQSKTAEIRALDVVGKPWEFPDGQEVLGYCTVEQVLEFISAVSKLPKVLTHCSCGTVHRRPVDAWERKWLGTVEKDLEDFDHVAASIGVEPDVLRNDSG
jgi:hypothetical protein